SPPQLSLARAFVSQESDRGLVITFNLDALNRNAEELPLHEVRYTLSLNGKPVFFGIRSPEANLRRLGTQTISIPAVVRLEPGQPRPGGGEGGPAGYTLEGRLVYSTPGHFARVLFDLNLRRPTIHFREQGSVDLAQHPPATTAHAP
ncbi:MAG: LEA type 2 family protein, partial [Phycisphaerales bacterium]